MSEGKHPNRPTPRFETDLMHCRTHGMPGGVVDNRLNSQMVEN